MKVLIKLLKIIWGTIGSGSLEILIDNSMKRAHSDDGKMAAQRAKVKQITVKATNNTNFRLIGEDSNGYNDQLVTKRKSKERISSKG